MDSLQAAKSEKIEAFVYAVIEKMQKYLVSKYEIEKINLKVICRFSDRYKRSWGGIKSNRPFMSFSLSGYLRNSESALFVEYDEFKNDPEIGEFTGSWHKNVAALVAHEFSHVIEYMDLYAIGMSSSFASKEYGNHGTIWKTIYRDLRNKFVNNGGYKDICSIAIAPSKTPTGPKRTVQRELKISRKQWNGGTLISYYTAATNKLLGHVFQRNGCYLQVLQAGGTWQKTTISSLVEVRKLYID